MLYLFAGARRRSDVRHFLEELCGKSGHTLHMEERDLLQHGEDDNLLNEEVWAGVKRSLSMGAWQVVLLSPPCNTWSRALYAQPPRLSMAVRHGIAQMPAGEPSSAAQPGGDPSGLGLVR